MKTRFSAALVLAAGMLASDSRPAAVTAEEVGARRALLIGINEYRSKDIVS